MSEKTLEQKFLDAFKSQYRNDFEYNEYPNEHIRMWFMNGYELAQKEMQEEIERRMFHYEVKLCTIEDRYLRIEVIEKQLELNSLLEWIKEKDGE